MKIHDWVTNFMNESERKKTGDREQSDADKEEYSDTQREHIRRK